MRKNVNFTEHRCRCSALSNIMSASRGSVITPKQLEELNDLLSKVSLTEKQAIRRDELLVKKESKLELSEGAKSYLNQVFLEVVFHRYKFIQTKYTEKGNICEHEGVKMANRVLGWDLSDEYINSIEFSKKRSINDYLTGEMDVNTPDLLADIKCPWDIHTFPFFSADVPSKSYYWQMQGYMFLTGHDRAELVYCLVDTPENLIQDEIRRRTWQSNVIELTPEQEDEIRDSMVFSDIPENMRVRRWVIEKNEADIEKIKDHVFLAREYLDELYQNLKNGVLNSK